MQDAKLELTCNYTILKQMSKHTKIFLCKEEATGRLLVIKSFERERLPFYHHEAYALGQLSELKEVPGLLFCSANKTDAFLGIQYLRGRPLIEIYESLNPAQKQAIKSTLSTFLKDLHEKNFFCHGDLNPKNILVHLLKDQVEIKIIDWEFAQPLRSENIHNYSKFRGTLGLTPELSTNSLIERDQQVLEKIFEKFLPGSKKVSKTFTQRLGRWI